MSAANDVWALGASPAARAARLVRRVTELCPLPASTQKVLALTATENFDTRDVARVVACDPALAARVLRIANSSFLGGRVHVTDLHKAVVAVGLAQIRTLAAGMAMLSAFRSDAEECVDLHAVGTMAANVAGAVAARAAPGQVGIAYSCALLCKLGALAALAVDGDEYVKIWRTVHAGARSWTSTARAARAAWEIERYGATTTALGALLFMRNALPAAMVRAVGADDVLPREAPVLDRIVAFARLAGAALVEEGSEAMNAEAIYDISKRTSLVEVDQGDLFERCLAARQSCAAAMRHVRRAV